MSYDDWKCTPPDEEREPGCLCDTCEGDNDECPNHGHSFDEPTEE